MTVSWLKLGAGTLLIGVVAVVFFVFKIERSSMSSGVKAGEKVELLSGHRSVRVDNARIVSAAEYTLSSPYAAKVDTWLVDEGDVVGTSGSPILKLETTELELELKKYEAALSQERAMVEKLERGNRYEELMVFQQNKKTAEVTKKGAKQAAFQVLYEAFVQSDDAIRNQTDPIFTNPEGDNPQLSFSLADTDRENEIESDRKALQGRLDDWQDLTEKLKAGNEIEKFFDKTESHIRVVRSYLDEVALAVNGLVAGAISQDTIDAWKAATITARANVSAVAVAVSETRAAYFSAKQGVDQATREFDLKVAGSDKKDIEAALDASDVAKSQMEVIAERLKQATITTPENNVLIKDILPQKGEFVTVGMPVAVVSSLNLEIEVDIPEENIRGIFPEAEILFRLSAFPEKDIRGKITRIESQEIEKQGSVYFRTHASIDLGSVASDMKLRSGMTGDVVIATQESGQLILLPKKYIQYQEGRSVVHVTTPSGMAREKIVETGLHQGERVEILSGLSVGEYVTE